MKAVQDHYSEEIMSTSFVGNPLGASRNPTLGKLRKELGRLTNPPAPELTRPIG